MTQATDMERQFQERIARAKEAARLASIAAMSRPASVPSAAPIAPPAPLQRPPPPRHLVPPPPARPVAMSSASIPEAVRHRIDRLVEFIARNGTVFEDTVRERERQNPEFAFLTPGAPFHDYFLWKKSQILSPMAVHPPPPPPGAVQAPMPPHAVARPAPRPLMPPPPVVSQMQPQHDPVFGISVGTMANALKAAKMRGLPAYSPLPLELLTASSIASSGVQPVEPARLDTRLAEFYGSATASP